MSGNRTLAQLKNKVESRTGISTALDVDMIHAMSERDNQLVTDEILSGSSGAFTYSFNLNGTMVQSVSVVGARHLAAHYGGIKHRLVASVDKVGPRFVFTTYPGGGVPAMSVNVALIEDMREEPDFYQVLVEVSDVKTGLTEQVEMIENRQERKSRKGKKEGDPDEFFDRPHYKKIAQSKALRNGILSILPQDLVQKFKAESVKIGNNVDITPDWMEEMRNGVIRYAVGKSIPINRIALANLSYAQLVGLRDAVTEGLETFKQSLDVMGCYGSGMREIPMEVTTSATTMNITDVPQEAAAPVAQAEQSAAQEAPAAVPETTEEKATEPTPKDQPRPMQRVDLDNPAEAVRIWTEMYGEDTARAMAMAQGEAFTAKLPKPQPKEADAVPEIPPYEGEVQQTQQQRRGRGRAEAKASPGRDRNNDDLFT